MTGYNSKFFRHDCRDKGCYVGQLPPWDDLIECFPRAIRPTDVDGLVEVNEHFLFLEEKSAGKSLDEGQRLALARLARLPRVTVVVFRPGAASELEALFFPNPDGFKPMTRDGFKEWLRGWVTASEETPV